MVSIPLDMPIIMAFIVVFLYVGTRIGCKAHAGWIFSKEMFMVLAVVVVLFCIGLDGQGIWHLLTTVGH